MIIEVRHTGFTNKGAELMLRAIIQQIRQRLPEATSVMIPDKAESYTARCELGLAQKAGYQRYRVRWGELARLAPQHIRLRFGIYTDAEIDVVLDASGFSYSDQWGLGSLREAARSSARWKRKNTKLVLLPQAFGPFSDARRKRYLKCLVENADLVFAREEQSYRHITEVTGERAHVKIAPDFTNLIQGFVPEGFDPKSNRFCVIPNYRMIDKTSTGASASYIDTMALMVAYLVTREAKPFLLIHEGENDLWLAEQINGRLSSPVNVIVEPNALAIKGIIGKSSGVISSRYHGIVSALSQGVPALGTSWSHKYEMLFADYGVSNYLINDSATEDKIKEKIDQLIDDPERTELVSTIAQHAAEYRAAAASMWDEVFSAISR